MNSRYLKKIITILGKGGVIATPTDTVYGLLADATNSEAIEKIYRIKGREGEKALPIFVENMEAAKEIVYISPEQESFLAQVWPGKVSAVIPLKEGAPLATNAIQKNRTVALRVPSHPLLLKILRAYKKPLTGTSANRSGQPNCLDIDSIKKQLAEHLPDFIIEGGVLPESQPSTIVNFTLNPPRIIRNGAEDKKVEQMLQHLLSQRT